MVTEQVSLQLRRTLVTDFKFPVDILVWDIVAAFDTRDRQTVYVTAVRKSIRKQRVDSGQGGDYVDKRFRDLVVVG
jgi:hypothetical protein